MAVSDYNPIIDAAAQEWDVDPHWVRSVMQGESGGQRYKNGKPITSSAGAGGLMQIIPSTARALGVQDVHDPVQAIWGGTKYLAQLRDQFNGNVPLATAAYNAGPERVGEYIANGKSLPNETRNYLREVSGHYQKFAGQPSAPSTFSPISTANAAPAAASKQAGPSVDDFLKEHFGEDDAVSVDGFLKKHFGEGEKTGSTISDSAASAPKFTPNDISGEGPDEYGNPLRPLAPPANPGTGPSFIESMTPPGLKAAPTTQFGNIPVDKLTPAQLDSELGIVGDSALSTPQLKAELTQRRALAASSGAAAEPAEPGFAHLLWANVVNPLASGGEVALGQRPIPRGLEAAEMALPAAGIGDLRFGTPLNPLKSAVPSPVVGSRMERLFDDRAARLDARIAEVTRNNPLVAKPANGAAPGNALSVATPPMPPATAAAVVAPRTSAAAKQIASAYYKQAEEAGGNLTPEFTNRFVDKVRSIAPQTAEGQAIAGDTEITRLADRIQSLRDQPISLKGAQEIDEGIGGLIDKEFGPKGLTKEGKHLLDLQANFRDMIQSAGPQDIAGGSVGFDALQPARKAWAQAMKMSDLERIQARAELTDNPATGVKSGIRVLLSNPTRVRGYTPEEITALKQAADRGALGGALHVFGSRLVPLAAGTAALGASGFIPAMAVAGATHLGSSVLRNAASSLQTKRMNNALSVLGSSVPPAP